MTRIEMTMPDDAYVRENSRRFVARAMADDDERDHYVQERKICEEQKVRSTHGG